ncbi:phospho-2-dehydro-3-deoxyheptonate aldolase [Bdellovibrio bacteriovorus]|uniref:Phospho-2-dehydro-3-deoxyheptonate aldolase n=1 Tax=Bdellovibrio bacteriovorus TaxID=959 RepID=A0A150WQ14_BDEBC|nr:3-deoxy-7-phosphoheptulonate synthase [Bdellovibrio bacteriovorus]KYG66285.1 phospho-2-dehydro-3-deoxyheptonate aldolase [Bdellovibrio bacteriovorus]
METQTMQTTPSTQIVNVGGYSIGGPEFTVIAGPCSIESREQFLETAMGVKASGAHLLRGGIWKMRTSSKDFQGLGTSSFDMIKDVCKQTGMSLVSEVTDARQIEQIYDVVECFQVGSRNMHNYALLKELGMQKKPVLLKRGFAALITEWVKAAEYVTVGGNPNVILCERGIRTFETSTRNTLDLNAVAFAKKNTSLPVIVDPSHAVGIRALVPDLAYAAAAVGADGIIVEVHPRPAEALSDGMQALTLNDFKVMMNKLDRILDAIDRPLHTQLQSEGAVVYAN